MPTHYPLLLDPRKYPDFDRRHVEVPTWETFENATQFTCLRWFHGSTLHIDDVVGELDAYTVYGDLGRVIWPHKYTIWADNLHELVGEIRDRGLYLFDIWSYSPECIRNGTLSNWKCPSGAYELLDRELGDRFLGFDNGEQDGRYMAYSPAQCPSVQDRLAQYGNFHKHFRKLWDQLGNRMTTLISLCYAHYFAREGNHLLLGAETAQALPNSAVYYAFIRGAGKQYGIHWFGNASVWNRWGVKIYPAEPETFQADTEWGARGPTKGTSLSLLKRLLYSHWMYNAVIVGFETSWFKSASGSPSWHEWVLPAGEDEAEQLLTPIGRIQRAAHRFVREQGHPGVMHAPVALMLDATAGWAMARHLYSRQVYQVWGAMPYDAGDHLTHAVMTLLYPGYEDSGFFHSEQGFQTPTPYGDMTDVMLSDAPAWTLGRYGLLIAGGRLAGGPELRDKLEAFVRGGGHLAITADNASRLFPELEIGPAERVEGGAEIDFGGEQVAEAHAFDLRPAKLDDGWEVLARIPERPVVARTSLGDGRITLMLSSFAINAEPLHDGPIENRCDEPIPHPYMLCAHARRTLDEMLSEEMIFRANPALNVITCRRRPGEYTFGVFNPHFEQREMRIESAGGEIRSMEEVELDQSEKGQVGYWAEGFEDAEPGVSDENNIAGGDVRLFRVTIDESAVRELPVVTAPEPPADRFLTLRDIPSVREAILTRPTFFQSFDGVKLDWTYLRDRDPAAVAAEGEWVARQSLRVAADFSPGCNLFPDLDVFDAPGHDWERTEWLFADVLDKLQTLGGELAVCKLSRGPTRWSAEQVRRKAVEGLGRLADQAVERGIRLLLQPHHQGIAGAVDAAAEMIDEVGPDRLGLAINVAHALIGGTSPGELVAQADGRAEMVLVSAPATDAFGQTYDAHALVAGTDVDLTPLGELDSVVVVDAVCPTPDAEYLEARALWG